MQLRMCTHFKRKILQLWYEFIYPARQIAHIKLSFGCSAIENTVKACPLIRNPMEMKTILSGIYLLWMVSWTYHLARPPSCLRGWIEADKEFCSPSNSPRRQETSHAKVSSPTSVSLQIGLGDTMSFSDQRWMGQASSAQQGPREAQLNVLMDKSILNLFHFTRQESL